MENIINRYALAAILLLGVTEANASANIYKCTVGGRVVYSNVPSVCANAKNTAVLAQVSVDRYPLDLGTRHEQGAAAHAYLRGMSTQIPHYSNAPDNSYMPDIVVPDISKY